MQYYVDLVVLVEVVYVEMVDIGQVDGEVVFVGFFEFFVLCWGYYVEDQVVVLLWCQWCLCDW